MHIPSTKEVSAAEPVFVGNLPEKQFPAMQGDRKKSSGILRRNSYEQ